MERSMVLDQTEYRKANFGFLWSMIRNPLDALTGLAHEQGDMARAKFRRRDIFLVNHPDFIEQVLVKQQGNFIKGPSLQRARLILGDGLLTSEGREHLEQRRSLQPAFQYQRVQQSLPVISENTSAAVSAWSGKTQLDVSDEMMRLTLNIALWAFFGMAPEGVADSVSRSMGTLTRLFPLTQLPLPEWVRGLIPGLDRAGSDLRQVTESLLRNPRSEEAKYALVNLLRQNNTVEFSEEQIHAHTLTFLLAGHETTALLLAWCLEMLAFHPQAQARLQKEVDDMLGDRFPHEEDLQNMSYTRMVVKETLRLRPPAWAIGRQAVEDCEIGGQHIPAGATVLASQWVTHHDARFYDDPHHFLPARWYEIENTNFPKYAFFPFGGGSRVCIGEHFAMTEAMTALAIMVRRWQFHPAQETHAVPSPSVTLRPNKNIKLNISPRAV